MCHCGPSGRTSRTLDISVEQGKVNEARFFDSAKSNFISNLHFVPQATRKGAPRFRLGGSPTGRRGGTGSDFADLGDKADRWPPQAASAPLRGPEADGISLMSRLSDAHMATVRA